MIIFGIHWGVVPIVMNNHATLGYDMILPLTVGCNFGIAAACLAVFLRTRNREMKQVAGSATISALIGGITEPGVYGVLIKYKKIFAAMCLFNGIGGIIGGLAHMTRDSMISVNLLTLPAVAAVYGKVLGTGKQFTILAHAQILTVIAHALQPAHHSQAHLGSEVGILAVGLLSASPTGVTEDVDVRCPERQTLVALDIARTLSLLRFHTRLVAHCGEHAVEQGIIP